jgi:hypothetical protein
LVGAFCPKCVYFIENIQFISIVLKAKSSTMPPVHAVELKSGMPVNQFRGKMFIRQHCLHFKAEVLHGFGVMKAGARREESLDRIPDVRKVVRGQNLL